MQLVLLSHARAKFARVMRSTKIAILSMPTRMKMKRTKYSISIAFLEMVSGESDGSVKLDDYVPAHLAGANL